MRTALSTVKFAAGFVANLLCQSMRSAFNLVAFAALSAYCVVAAALAALKLAGGGRRDASELGGKAWRAAKSAGRAGLASLLQAAGAATLVSPMIRAAQACSERMSPRGLISPAGKNLNFWQETFGINSWDDPPEESKPARRAAAKPRTNVTIAAASKKKESDEGAWERIVAEYLAARTAREMDGIRARMALGHPSRYAALLEEAGRPGKSRVRAA